MITADLNPFYCEKKYEKSTKSLVNLILAGNKRPCMSESRFLANLNRFVPRRSAYFKFKLLVSQQSLTPHSGHYFRSNYHQVKTHSCIFALPFILMPTQLRIPFNITIIVRFKQRACKGYI